MTSDILEVSHQEVMRRFLYLYRMEKLPHEAVATAVWYASEASCGSLVWVGKAKKKARIKGTITAPEARGEGHGAAMLEHLIAEAVKGGAEIVEVFARNPDWYLKNGFSVDRVTNWGVTVLSKPLLES